MYISLEDLGFILTGNISIFAEKTLCKCQKFMTRILYILLLTHFILTDYFVTRHVCKCIQLECMNKYCKQHKQQHLVRQDCSVTNATNNNIEIFNKDSEN